MSERLRMTPLMHKYYTHWLNTETLLGNPRDADRFYQFVKACIRYGRKRRSGSWLRSFLETDLKGRFCDDYLEQLISDAVSIFDHIAEYEDVVFPDPMVHLTNPPSVSAAMSLIKKPDGTRFYTDQEIEAFIQQHFK
ncbi:MAG: hypothetical protein JXR94_04730 [Candidatus Hydrogenedentes bacterium]|nr:hypothetical protein [Candidatus Hydrogenedentota bacterium]